MNNRLGLWVLAFCCLLLGACKKNTVPAATAAPETINKVTIQNLDFRNFTSKARIIYEGKEEKMASAITIRIKKDSIIWVSVVPGLGIEALRAKITPDSIYVINRLQKEYFAGNYDFLKRRFNIDLTYNMVEGLVLGNYIPASPESEKLMNEDPFQHIRSEAGHITTDHFIHTKDFKLKKSSITDNQTENIISVDYTQFEPLADILFARAALVSMVKDGQARATITVNHNKVTVNEKDLSFPFSIPDGYRAMTP